MVVKEARPKSMVVKDARPKRVTATPGACTRLKGANYRYNLTRVVSTGAFIDIDADEIRLLLKDQATAQQQQTAALQAQLAALQADLQATKLLVQTRSGGGGDQVRGHKCLGKFLLLMADDEDECESPADEAVESDDISILNSLVGHGSPRSLQLWGTLGIGGGQGPDVVLGIQWLQHMGKVTHDYAHQSMEFTVGNKTYTLKGEESLRMKQMSFNHMRALLESDEVYGIYEAYNLAAKEERPINTQVPTVLPPHRSIDHRIHLYPETKPVNVRPYRYPHYQKNEMEKLVNEMLSQWIIRFSHSPFSSPVLLVKKKDRNYHFCVDYRALNAVTVKDKFPIPTADEMFDDLGCAPIFTKPDLRTGYHQIRVHERDVYKTAFRMHDGHYEFLVMPFGLTNAPSTFQATMNRLFSPYLRKFVIVFFDDILIYSASLVAHLEHLQCMFKCLQDNKLYVKQSKCVFGVTTLEYLGHIISGRGVEMDPKKIAAIGAAEAAAFNALKHQLSHALILCLPNFNDTFVIEADASSEGIGAVLLQQRRPLSYFSRKLGPRMRIVATYHKELFAIVIQTPLQQKYIRKLMGFDFLIEYKPGVSNQVADAFSCIYEEYEGIITSLMAMSRPLVGLINDLKQENETVEDLRQLHRKLDREERLEGFRREQGLLLYRGRYYFGTESKLKDLLLSEFHNTPSARHWGMKKMLATGELLQPLPTPVAVWEDVSMDFIIGLPASKGLTVILVVVNRFSKYSHFGTLPTSFNAPKVAELFMEIIVKHYGFPKTIVFDRDPIFTEVVNHGLEQYLRAMVSDRPQHLVRLLPWAEFSYNTTFRSSIKMTPYQDLYGRIPPSFIPYPPGSSKVATVDELLVEWDALLRQLKHNLIAAKHLAKPLSNKLAKHHYGPFEVLERVGKVAYRLALPPTILVQWGGRSPEEATWEWVSEFQATYPSYHLKDKVIVEGEDNDTSMVVKEARPKSMVVKEARPKRVTAIPGWQQDYVMG
ncbi:ty3-gypsy retrotransposon protein [Tanacetum coccineum]